MMKFSVYLHHEDFVSKANKYFRMKQYVDLVTPVVSI